MTDNTDTPTAQFFAGTPEYEDARRRFRPGRPPRTPGALPTREQIAALVRFWAEAYDAVARGSDESLYANDSDMPESIADAVLDLIDKENTMPDDTIPVPRALIEAAASGRMTFEQVRDIRALLDPPKPSAPRLRVVDANTMPFEGGVTHWNAWGHNLEAQPDVLTVIERTEGKATADRIRAALGVEGD